ncbi:hypothetical protein FRUB_10498 [Fimbriiglobus ruber]|uniref:Uncharacterized protein n=1 Tax=Fimbriiglobus ruber TaxID=1908690 RepID=A0A225DEI0_9BACT|nr:hypothetical protein FRUB_10498 [Fimbriiglobus ruber]
MSRVTVTVGVHRVRRRARSSELAGDVGRGVEVLGLFDLNT